MNAQAITVQSQTTQAGFMDFSNLENALKSAEIIANSSICPSVYRGKSGDVLVAVQFGFEIGLKPLQSIQNIAVINGRPCIWGDAMLAICLSKPDFEYCHEHFDEKTQTAICTIKRMGMPEVTKTFGIEDAKIAGLWGKQGPWSTYPKRMMQMRARGFATRDVGADWLKGIILREEAQDYPVERLEKEFNQTVKIKNVADSLKAKLQNKSTVATAELETIKNLLSSPLDKKSFESVESTEPLVQGETKENLFVLYESSEEFQRRIDEWLDKKNIVNLQDLTEKQAKKIIGQLEKETPKAREYWDDYLSKKELNEITGSAA